ncbi:MAG TPA: mechanosensitive ion channel protein MscS [Candidatus Omnitrophica bacterium]|nr:mechanosensitive ion channel protein MscS [Candidatus Omnitrophota bacterium]
MNNILILGMQIPAWLIGPAIIFIWLSILFIIKKLVFLNLKKWANRTKSGLDNILIESLDFPLTLLIFFSATFFLERLFPATKDTTVINYLYAGFKAVAIIAVILFFDKLLKALIETYSSNIEILKASKSVVTAVVRILVIAVGLLIILDSFGISITPILASLGIGSLAVALALQPTLENFFSGIQMIIDKPIQVGQFVKLDTGEEGYVEKIGWRSTWVRMLPNNMVILPNKTIVNSKVINYYYPTKETAVLVQVGVHYNSDLKHVEKVTEEVAEETLKTVLGGVPEFKPFIRYHTFSDFSINFTVILSAKEFVDNYLIKHEFIKRLHERYNKEGIIIPYPIRAINTEQEQKK